MANCLQPPAWLLPASFLFSIAANHSQTDNEGFFFFFVVVLNCGVRILLVIGVCRSRWQTGRDTHWAANTPAAAPAAGGATRPEAWTEPAWVAPDEPVLAVKTQSPEGHLSPKCCLSKDTCSGSFFPSCAKWKGSLVSNTQSLFPLSPYRQPKLQGEFVTPSLQRQNSLWLKATRFSKNSVLIPTAQSLMRFSPCKAIISNTLRSHGHC